MLNVLLIHPWKPEIFPPPAIGYLRAALEFNGKPVTVTSSYLGHNLPEQADFVGISVHSFAVRNVCKMLPQLRAKYPNAKFIAGGHHSTALPEQMLEIGFDQVVAGPGELRIQEIIFGDCVDQFLPLPNYSDLDIGWSMPAYQGGRGIGIVSSRGCPFECSFCASSNFWKRKWTPLKPDLVMQTLEAQIQHYKLTSWMFEDDNFTLNVDRAIEICDRIKASPITNKMPWQAASRAESLCSETLCKALKDAGCAKVWLGVESLCQRTLDRCKKNTRVENVLNGIATARSLRLGLVCQFIAGLPGETEETMSENCELIRRHRISAGVNKAWILPGTEIHRLAKEHYGFDDKIYLNGIPLYTFEWEPGTLDRWVGKIRGSIP